MPLPGHARMSGHPRPDQDCDGSDIGPVQQIEGFPSYEKITKQVNFSIYFCGESNMYIKSMLASAVLAMSAATTAQAAVVDFQGTSYDVTSITTSFTDASTILMAQVW